MEGKVFKRNSLGWAILDIALLLVVLRLLAGCAPTPQVVTVVVPSIAILPLDSSDDALGRTGCDLMGQPVIFLNGKLTESSKSWVLVHERIHVAQVRAFKGGCEAFSKKYISDSTFKLRVELEAFCQVYLAQVSLGNKPSPDIQGIVWRIMNKYQSEYTEVEVRKYLDCEPP